MRFFGLDFSFRGREKAAVGATTVPAAAVAGYGSAGRSYGVLGSILESFTGAWQKNVVLDSPSTMLAFSPVFACVRLISGDIAKLRIKLVEFKDGIWTETTSPAFSPVLRKPNTYQTRIQFLQCWVISKLIWGNTYVWKERDQRGVVVAMHVLAPQLVKVLVADNTDVFYELRTDRVAGIVGNITVPATEIIHDRGECLFHPLIGVSPLYAGAMSATQGNRIQGNSAKFFENMSRPSGIITTAETIPDETAERIKRDFEANFSGRNLGRLLVMGDGLKYESMSQPAQQAQLIEQLKWTVEDVARCFLVPLHKIGAATNVKYSNMGEMNQDYYSQTLQLLIESIEILLDEGLGLAKDGSTQTLGVELDLEGLLRMDPVQRAERNAAAMKAGYLAPDEARANENLPAVPEGAGKVPFMQQQNYPLTLLAQQKVPGSEPVAPADPPADDGQAAAAAAAAAADAAKKQAEALGAMLADSVSQTRAAVESLVERSIKAVTEAADAAEDTAAAVVRRQASLDADAERRHADRLVVEQCARDEIAAERQALAVERAALAAEAERLAEESRIAKATADLDDDVGPAELAQALIARLTEG